ncbi:MAG: hypothetical protein AB9842_03885 [Bacteroidales bacterium]
MRKLFGVFLLLVIIAACNLTFDKNIRKNYGDVNSLLRSDTAAWLFLKAHTHKGDVYLFHDKWKVSDDSLHLTGNTVDHYNPRRSLAESGKIAVPLTEIILLETNLPAKNADAAYFTDLGIITIFDAVLTLYCLSNPKACFGSCPTFYYQEDQYVFSSNAEGFSSSITPSLEKGDIDALGNPEINSRDFRLLMKNEAQETHAVNQVELLAVPRSKGQRVFHDAEGSFFLGSTAVSPDIAKAPEGNILPLLESIDDKERYSVTDNEDLKKKEIIDLTFKNNRGNTQGLVLNFRQSLLPTFLFYSALSYMGDELSDVLAGVETNPFMRRELESSFRILGGIEVLAWNPLHSEWEKIQTLFEAGPIARNLQIIPLPSECCENREIKVRLRMSQGLWRIDYAGLSNILKKADPVHIKADKIERNGESHPDALKALMIDDKKYQLSLPGDKFTFHFAFPDDRDYELFVYSKGYYLEWARKEWLPGKDLGRLRKMVLGDENTWKELAREFKTMESSMESAFWNSRVNL